MFSLFVKNLIYLLFYQFYRLNYSNPNFYFET